MYRRLLARRSSGVSATATVGTWSKRLAEYVGLIRSLAFSPGIPPVRLRFERDGPSDSGGRAARRRGIRVSTWSRYFLSSPSSIGIIFRDVFLVVFDPTDVKLIEEWAARRPRVSRTWILPMRPKDMGRVLSTGRMGLPNPIGTTIAVTISELGPHGLPRTRQKPASSVRTGRRFLPGWTGPAQCRSPAGGPGRPD